MPPKKQNAPAKAKVDLTFGMKNKKGGKGQAAVKVLQAQADQKGKNKETLNKEKEKQMLAARKAAEQKKKDEERELFNTMDTIVQPKVPFGVDPKTVLCAFHKAGRCQKGTKCKFSHDLDQDRKAQKASIYADQRDAGKLDKKEDTMDKWDEAKLREVVSRKGNSVTTTDIVCKHFIDAVEAGNFGWFWECPNGDDCKYRHALPPGFVLKSQRKKEEEDAKKVTITMEEFLEVERHKLDQSKLTPMTAESFAAWKKNRVDRKTAQAQLQDKVKAEKQAMGKNNGMSGRDLFTFNPNLGLSDDEDDGDDEDDFDVQLMRIRKEREDRQDEVLRLRALDQMYGGMSMEDHAEEEETPAPAEADAAGPS